MRKFVLSILCLFGLSTFFEESAFGEAAENSEVHYLKKLEKEETRLATIKKSHHSSSENIQINLSSWMTELWNKIKHKKLKDIVIPGTHDSGTAPIGEDYAVMSNDGRIPGVAKIAPQKIAPWSKTQDLIIRDQLKVGVRFFDFRLSVEDHNVMYLSHGLRGEKLTEVLDSISRFCSRNPKELVIIKVKGFLDQKCQTEDYNKLIADNFAKYLKDQMLCNSDLKTDLPSATLEQIINSGKNIIVLFDARVKNKKNTGFLMKRALKNNDWLLNGEVLESPWGNTDSVSELYEYTIKSAMKVNMKKLYALHWTLTANPKYILSHLNNSDGIRYMTNKLNGGKYYKAEYSLRSLLKRLPRINIILHDFITKEKSEYLVKMNLK